MSAGFKLSFSAKNKDALKPSSKIKATPNGAPLAKRPRLALDDDEPQDKHESVEISGWDTATGGAIDLNGKKEEGPRVIPALPNQWHAIAKAKVARQAQAAGRGDVQKEVNTEELKDTEIAYGLTVTKKVVEDGEEKVTVEEMVVETEKDDSLTEEQRLEKRALDALINGKETDTQTVIPQTEQEAFEHDYTNAPDAPTLDAYEATPIDGFGAALLRGMGWKDGEEIGRSKISTTKVKEVKRRPALLGIGAKEEAAVGVEFGEYGGKGKGSKKKIDQVYNPIVMKNKKTGELISEEELKTKIEGQELVQENDGKKERSERYSKSRYSDYSEDEEEGRRRDKRRKEKKGVERRDRSKSGTRDDGSRHRDRRREDDHYDSDRRKEKRHDDDLYESDRHKERRPHNDHYQTNKFKGRYRDDDRFESDRRKDKRRGENLYTSDRKKDKYREQGYRDRSQSPVGDDRRKRRRDYEDERDDRKRRHKDDKYYRR